MNPISRLRDGWRRYGARGVAARALRRAARGVEREPPAAASPSLPCDEFLTWVRFAVPGMLAEPNVAAMDHALAHMPAGSPVLEVGSFCGLSTVVLAHLLEKRSPESPLFTCDTWAFEGQQLGSPLGGSRSLTHDGYRSYVRDSFLRAARTFAGERLPFTIECDSDELFRRWSAGETTVDVFGRDVTLGGELGFCYIDGNHTYEFARRDFENTDRALAPGGFVLFDDSADGSEWEVNRLVREIAGTNGYELVSKNPNYMFRKS